MSQNNIRVALLHHAPRAAEVEHNRALVERVVRSAAADGAQWIVTPELVISGYSFAKTIGTDWIHAQPDERMRDFCRLVQTLRVTVFLSHAEREIETGKLYNTVFVIDPNGGVVGKQRKRLTLPQGAEAWSSAGGSTAPISVEPCGKVGIMICADAYPKEIASELCAQGARVLVSSAAWAPGMHGPNGEWEARTLETGLPLFVCNRTGTDPTLDFTASESIVAYKGKRLATWRAEDSTIFVFDWDLSLRKPAPQRVRRITPGGGAVNV